MTTKPHVRLRCAAASDVGLRRQINEDSYLARFPVYLVADGMGGHQAGDLASAAVVAAMDSSIPGDDFASMTVLAEALNHTARTLSDFGMQAGNPGSTMSGLVLSTHRASPCLRVFNVGDSRTYAYSQGRFWQITQDHTELEELRRTGILDTLDPSEHPSRSILTRALGAGFSPFIPIDQHILPVYAGDRYIVCSDGVSGEVDPGIIESAVRYTDDPQELANNLISFSLQAGGKDNATVIVLDILEAEGTYSALVSEDSTINCAETSCEDTLPNGIRVSG